ncbi:MAG: chloride channel protein [Candidatus Binatia bacterium]
MQTACSQRLREHRARLYAAPPHGHEPQTAWEGRDIVKTEEAKWRSEGTTGHEGKQTGATARREDGVPSGRRKPNPRAWWSFYHLIRTRLHDQLEHVQPFSLILQACMVGAITGVGAIGFSELIHVIQWGALGSHDLPLHRLPELPWYQVLAIPAIGGGFVALVHHFFARGPGGHGVPEVMEAVAFGGGGLRPRSAWARALMSALTIGSGGSVGREGPMVHLGASLGSLLGHTLRVTPSRLATLTGCGVAGGIAAAFNAPIAGALFALEVVMGNFAMPAFGPVMLSSVVATVVSRSYFGDHPAFIVPAYTVLSVWEIPLYLGLGVVCGICGLIFMFVLETMERGASALPVPVIVKPALGGLLLGVIILWVPNVYGIGYATMDQILRGGMTWSWLLLLLPVKMIATSVTLASGGAGGLFLPALYLGAIVGGLFGITVGALFPAHTSPSGAYALVAMSAFLAGVVHCPITALILLFELTADYHIILPLMTSCVVSTLVTKLGRDDSIYTLQLSRRGVDIRRREENVMRAFTVGHVMRKHAPALSEAAPFAEVVQHFLSSPLPLCFIFDADNRVVGVVSIHEVKSLLQDQELETLVVARDLAIPCRVWTTEDETLAQCLEKFGLFEQEYLPVLSETQHLQGIIAQRDVLNIYNQEVLRHEYLGLSLQGNVGDGAVRENVRLPHHYEVEVVAIPPHYAGKTLKDLQLRTRLGVQAIAMRRGGMDRPDELPDPDVTLTGHDYLVLVGRQEDIGRFRHATATS